jgi:hypothetical protein
MKTGLKLLLAFVIALGAAFPAMAGTVTPGPCGGSGCLVLSGLDTSQHAIDLIIEKFNPDLVELYKATQATLSDEGAFQNSYNTAFGVADLGLANARISYVSDPAISSNSVYVLIKDGDLGWSFWDISGWNGTDAIEFSSFYGGNQGKISHVTIYGPSSAVPDGGLTVMLLGLGVGSLALFSRKFRQ